MSETSSRPLSPARQRLYGIAIGCFFFGGGAVLTAIWWGVAGAWSWPYCVVVALVGLVTLIPGYLTVRKLRDTPAAILDADPGPATPLRAVITAGLIVAVYLGGIAIRLSSIHDLQTSPTPTRRYGQVEHIHAFDNRWARRGTGAGVRVQLAGDPHWYEWKCHLFCEPYRALSGMWDRPWPMAEVFTVRQAIVGLKLDGRSYVDTGQEYRRQIREEWAALAIWIPVGALIVLAAVAWARMRVLYPHFDYAAAGRRMGRQMERRRKAARQGGPGT